MEPDPEEGGDKKPPVKKNARAILESVCSDFENIDLPCPPRQKKPSATPRGLADFIQYRPPPADALPTTITEEEAAPGDVLTLNDASRLVSNLFCAGGGADMSSSVAELADAEIVQTGEDCVSIIITNPRFVEVMTGPAQAAVAPVDDAPPSSPEAVVAPEPRRPAFDKPVVYRPDSNPKARRITAKMRSAWAEELATKGHLTCPLPGCLQTFETMTNFRTHYKFCAGTARFEKCLHCSSLIIASKSAMFRHMQVEHPERLPEGAVPPPASPERPTDFFLADFADSEVYTEEVPATKRHLKSASKENFMRATRKGRGAIFKNKKRVKESLIRNMEEFRRCVRFDSIVDKIRGVEEGVLHPHRPPNRGAHRGAPGRRRPRLFLAPNVVAKEKIFEDEADDPEAAPESRYDSPVHTKSRLVLPFEPRYKRYSEHLRVSRDWTSARKTYSRSRPPPPSDPGGARLWAAEEEAEPASRPGGEPAELSLSASLDASGLSVEHAFPAASHEVVCGAETQAARTEESRTIKVEKSDRPVTPSAKFIFYGLPPKSEGGLFSPFKASRAAQRPPPSKEDGIKLPSREPPPTRRGRGRPPKGGEARMCAIGKRIAAKKLKRAKRGRPRKGEYRLSKEAEAKMAVRSTRGGRQGPYGRVHKLPPSRMQALNNIVSNMYRAQKSLALQKVVTSTSTESVQPVGADGVSETGISPANMTTSPVVEQSTGAVMPPVRVTTATSEEESASTGIPPVEVATAAPFEQSTVVDVHPVAEKDIETSNSADASQKTVSPSKTAHISPTIVTLASPVDQSTSTDVASSKVAVMTSPVGVSANDTISPVKASGVEEPSSVSIHSMEATKASPVKESSPVEQESATKPSTKVVPAPCLKDSIADTSKPVETADKIPTPQKPEVTPDERSEPAEPANEASKSERGVHSPSKNDDVSNQITITEPSTTNAVPEGSLPEEDLASVVATPTPEKKRGRGRPRKVPKEDTDSEKAPKPTIQEKEPAPPPITPDLPSPGIRKSQRARKSKFSADHSDYVSALTPQKAPKTRIESPRVDTPIGKSPGIDTHISTSSVVDTPVAESPKVDTPLGTPVGKSPVAATPVGKSPIVPTPVSESPGDVVVKRKRGRPRKNSSVPPTPAAPDPPPSAAQEPEVPPREESTPRRGRKSRKAVVPRTVCPPDLEETRKKEAEELLSEVSAISNSRRREPAPPPPPAEEAGECRCAELTLPLKKRKHQKAPEKRCPHAGTPACSETTKTPPPKKKKEQEKKQPPPEIVPDAVVPVQEKVPEESNEVPERRTSKRLSLTKRKSYTPADSDREDDEERDQDYVPEEEEEEAVSSAPPPVGPHPRRRGMSAMKHWKEISVPVLEGSERKYVSESEERPFPEFVSRRASFCPVEPDRQNLPPFPMSLNILVGERPGWTRLARFRALPVERVENHWTLFAGGPVLCSAWAPVSAPGGPQWVALSVNASLSRGTYSCASRGPERGQLQLWNLGSLRDKRRLERQPKMELALCFDHLVHDLAFCPAPSDDDPENYAPDSELLPRLGLLAAACSDALVRIYAIPHPTSLRGAVDPPLVSANPVAVLEPLCDPSDRSVCSALCWERKGANALICAGYGSGLVCVYHLRGPPLERGTLKLSPHACFQAHGAPVTSISLAPLPGARFLLTSSLDKVLKFWDLHSDLCAPSFCLLRKGQVRQAHWPAHWAGSFGCLEDGASAADHFSRELREPSARRSELPLRLLANHAHPCTKSAVSEFLNAQVIADMGGSVSVSVLYSPKMSHPANTIVYSSVLEELEDNVSEDISPLLSDLVDVVLSIEKLSGATFHREEEVRMNVDDVTIWTADEAPRDVRTGTETPVGQQNDRVSVDVTMPIEEVASREEVAMDTILHRDVVRMMEVGDVQIPTGDATSGEVQMDASRHNEEVQIGVEVDDVSIPTEDEIQMDSRAPAIRQEELRMEFNVSCPMEDGMSHEVEGTTFNGGSEASRNVVPEILGTDVKKLHSGMVSQPDSQNYRAADTPASENGSLETKDCGPPSDSTKMFNVTSTEDSISSKDANSNGQNSVKQESEMEYVSEAIQNKCDASSFQHEEEDLKVKHEVPNNEISDLSPSSKSLHHSDCASPTNPRRSSESSSPKAKLASRAISKKIQLKYLRPKMASPFKSRRVKSVNGTSASHRVSMDCSEETEASKVADQTKAKLPSLTSHMAEVGPSITGCLDDVKDTVSSLEVMVNVTSWLDDVKSTVTSLDDVINNCITNCIDEQGTAVTCLDKMVLVTSCVDEIEAAVTSMDKMASVTSCMDEVEATVTSLEGMASVTSCLDEVEATVTSLDEIASVTSCMNEIEATVTSLDGIASVTSCMNEVEATVTSLDGIASVTSCLDEVEATVTSLDEVANLTTCVEEMQSTITHCLEKEKSAYTGPNASWISNDVTPSESEVRLPMTHNLDDVEVMVTSCFDEDSVDSLTDEVRVSDTGPTLLHQTLEKNFRAFSQNDCAISSTDSCSCVGKSPSSETFRGKCAFCRTLLRNVDPDSRSECRIEGSRSGTKSGDSDGDSWTVVPQSDSGAEVVSGSVRGALDSLLECVDHSDSSAGRRGSEKMSIGKRRLAEIRESPLPRKKKSKSVRRLGIASATGESGREETSEGCLGDLRDYEKIASTRGLVFRDNFNLWKCRTLQNEPPTPTEVSNLESLHFDPFSLTSINTVCWNPNFGCRFWICTGAQSGIVRISCLADLVPQPE